jgi:hypothetical protein
MSTRLDRVIDEGSMHVFVINILGGPDDLTGYVGSMQVRATKTAPTTLAEVDPDNITVNEITRQVIVEIPNEATVDYEWSGLAVYDLYIEGPLGDRWRVVEGTIRISREVTREE